MRLRNLTRASDPIVPVPIHPSFTTLGIDLTVRPSELKYRNEGENSTMTKTRRQSKAADADAPEGHFNITLPEDLDEDQLSEILPDINLSSISPEDVVTLYRTLLTHAVNLDAVERERDEVRAELEKKDIELDQALQDKESLSKDLESSVETVHEELAQVKRERDQLGFCSHPISLI